ncbi:hypothetical protein [Pyrobaculum islandicum]|nr:hypothetical protein [Pyrobaculum islandicum]
MGDVKFETRYCENGCTAFITGKPTLLVNLERVIQWGTHTDPAYLNDALC